MAHPLADGPMRMWGFTLEPSRLMRAEGWGWEHEIRVALPASYADNDSAYPVLWITDNELEPALSVLRGQELILVSIGAGNVAAREITTRRMYDFSPAEDLFWDGPTGEYARHRTAALYPEFVQPGAAGGAVGFLDFLIDDVRPALAAAYRMDPDAHGLLGFSAGGMFVVYAIFARPAEFAKYICGSPPLYSGNSILFEMEERYATAHDDLAAHIFLGAGEAEIAETSAWGCVSSMVKMAELLFLRAYPSLKLDVKIFPGETHGTALLPLINWGVKAVWGDKIAPSWWSRLVIEELENRGLH